MAWAKDSSEKQVSQLINNVPSAPPQAINTVIAAGHGRDALGYGWGWFWRCHRAISLNQREEQQRMAVAVRVGRFADDKEWEKFLE